MKVALVTSGQLANRAGAARHVRALAHGLTERGADVELLTQRSPALLLRLVASSFDVADVHSADARLALAVIRGGARRCVFTPHAPIQRLAAWPHARTTATAIARASETVCNSSYERDVLCERFPGAVGRVSVIPVTVDVDAIRAARPFPLTGRVVLAVGRLDRGKRIDRAIAAMASLEADFRLVVAGTGPLLHRLQAHAADLRVSSRVEFVGPVGDAELYRWLRSAAAVVALHDDHSSGLHVAEALAAGASVVASELPVHREAAARFAGARVKFVSRGSPFEVADAITELARPGACFASSAGRAVVPSPDRVVDRVWDLYRRLIEGGRPITHLPQIRVA
ncbi:MAG: glycosyltransferase family 4 protein [Solirubrobacterales bacterium]|nr:glycosyltransferase family 4 protein [Solirubrobacterales bacterium]MBV9798843.1 glycosyltransferase family 4 protein [Solirubrobacterales bacterium]